MQFVMVVDSVSTVHELIVKWYGNSVNSGHQTTTFPSNDLPSTVNSTFTFLLTKIQTLVSIIGLGLNMK